MQSSHHILVIEDDQDARAGLCDILELDGFVPTAVASFNEAIEAVRQHRFGVILSDRRLPDGVVDDHLATLQEHAREAEILVVTGYGDIESTIEAFRQGVSDYVTKPIVPEELIRTVRRIVDQRDLRLRLKKEHRFNERILATAEAIVLVLDLEGRVVQFNRYFEHLTGWTKETLLGEDWFAKCLPEEERERIREVFEKTAFELESSGVVNAILKSDGGRVDVRWSNTTIADEEDQQRFVLAIGVDITDYLQANQRAMQSERLAAIGQTMTALAHESRNALQRIHAAAEVLQLDLQDQPDAADDLAAITRATEELRVLLESVRSFAAPVHVERQPCSIVNIARGAWEDLRSTLQDRRVELLERGVDTPPVLLLDEQKLKQVFRNLFANAIEVCSDPVRLTLEFRTTDDAVEVAVIDNGPGFNSDDAKRMFEPFFTTKATGTGLGLPISSRIIEAHGGDLIAVPHQDHGHFLVRIPTQGASR